MNVIRAGAGNLDVVDVIDTRGDSSDSERFPKINYCISIDLVG